MCNILLLVEDVGEIIKEFCEEIFSVIINQYILLQLLFEQWDIEGLEVVLYSDFVVCLLIQQWLDEDDKLYEEILCSKIFEQIVVVYYEKEELVGVEVLCVFEKQMLLWVLDDLWKDYLLIMDYLWYGIYLCGYVQKNFKQEYKCEFFILFQELLDLIKCDIICVLFYVQVCCEDLVEEEVCLCCEVEELVKCMQFQYVEVFSMEQVVVGEEEEFFEGLVLVVLFEFVCNEQKIGCNEFCLCGFGKKYKYCYGQLD